MSLKAIRERERAIDVQLVLWACNGNWKLDLRIFLQGSLSCPVTLCKTLMFPPILLKTAWKTGLTKM